MIKAGPANWRDWLEPFVLNSDSLDRPRADHCDNEFCKSCESCQQTYNTSHRTANTNDPIQTLFSRFW
jgi:hypothetical protein